MFLIQKNLLDSLPSASVVSIILNPFQAQFRFEPLIGVRLFYFFQLLACTGRIEEKQSTQESLICHPTTFFHGAVF